MDASGLKYLTQVELEGYSKEKKESLEWLKENEKGKGRIEFKTLKLFEYKKILQENVMSTTTLMSFFCY